MDFVKCINAILRDEYIETENIKLLWDILKVTRKVYSYRDESENVQHRSEVKRNHTHKKRNEIYKRKYVNRYT